MVFEINKRLSIDYFIVTLFVFVHCTSSYYVLLKVGEIAEIPRCTNLLKREWVELIQV